MLVDNSIGIKEWKKNICFLLVACTGAFKGLGFPLGSNCLDCSIDYGVWKETALLFIVKLIAKNFSGAALVRCTNSSLFSLLSSFSDLKIINVGPPWHSSFQAWVIFEDPEHWLMVNTSLLCQFNNIFASVGFHGTLHKANGIGGSDSFVVVPPLVGGCIGAQFSFERTSQ